MRNDFRHDYRPSRRTPQQHRARRPQAKSAFGRKQNSFSHRNKIIGYCVFFGVAIVIVLLTKNWEGKALQEIANRPAPQSTYVQVAIGSDEPFTVPHSDYQANDNIWKLINNSTESLGQYEPSDLATITAPSLIKSSDNNRVRSVINAPLRQLTEDAARQGHQLTVSSAYRSPAVQQEIRNTYANQGGDALADQFSAKLGYSEHQLGLAVDLNTQQPGCTEAVCSLSDNDAQWIAQNAHRYGFIVRYQEGKEATTGYSPEPWHIRYVGKRLAAALYKHNLTLEEVQPNLTKAREQLQERGYIQ